MGRAERQASIICRMAHARRAAQVALLAAILFVTMPSTYGFSPDSTSEDVIHLAEDLGEATRKTVAVPVKPLKAKKPAKVKATAKARKARGGKAKPKTSSGGTKKVSQTHVAKAAKKVSKKATAVLHKNKQRDLRLVERLLKNPIIDPRTEKAYKRAAESVEKSKKKIKAKLANVEEMAIVADKLAGTAMERAAKARAGCVDSHPGICAGVKVQGHCGIKAYAKACSLSCHLCSIKPGFVMGSPRERKHKGAVEKAGKHAAKVKAAEEAKKIRERKSKASKAKEKKGKDMQKLAEAAKSLEAKKKKLALAKGVKEKKMKQAKNNALLAAEQSTKAKEKLKKDKAKIKAKKVSDQQVKWAKERAKKEQNRVKREKKREKAAKKAHKDAVKKLKAARKRKAKYAAAVEKLQKSKEKLVENRAGLRRARRNAEVARKKAEANIEIAKKAAEVKQESAKKVLAKKRAREKIKLEVVAKAKARAKVIGNKAELVSKAEKKRLRKLSTGGAKKRVLRELMRAKKEVTATKVKLKQISLKYKGLGKAFKTPPVLLSALKKAIAAKKLAEQQMMELNAEKHSPKAKRMKKKEIKAKVKAKKAQDHVKALTKKKKNVNKA